MRLQFFSVSAQFPEESQQLLNSFCAQHRVLTVDKQFVDLGAESYWSICVSYIEGRVQSALKSADKKRERIDYKEVLGERDFSFYVKLRDLRKSLSEQEGVPAYALFTNEQLASMITQRVSTESELSKIEGIGKARLEKYGKAFIGVLNAVRNSQAATNDEATSD